MKRVLIYGDSNVWGDNFAGPRVAYHLRWVNRLKKKLGKEFVVISDGVGGRVAGDYRDDKPDRNGKHYFEKSFFGAGNLDLVIVALGTNDLQKKFKRSVDDILADLKWYGGKANGVRTVFILPPNFDSESGASGPEFVASSQTLRSQLIARKNELSDTIEVDGFELSDGVHLSPNGHKKMATDVYSALKTRDV